MLIRSDRGRRKALEERNGYLADLEAGLIKDDSWSVYEARIARIDAAVGEYERLTAGGVERLEGEGVLDLGALLIKARVARGMTLAELGERMDEEDPVAPQQVGRYEDEGWRRTGLWRLRQAADALGLRVRVEADLGPLDAPPGGPRRGA